MAEKYFFEKKLPNTNQNYKIGFLLKKKVFSAKSKYHKIEVFDTYGMGKLLVLDGILQLSEKYEFIYHEMLSHLPLFKYPNVKKVLIIGGGDGGVLREVLKHPIKQVFLCDIDKKVSEVSKKYFPSLKLKNSLKDKRLKLVFEDGIKFVRNFKNYFDVIICDSTDPSELSKGLFSKKFYQNVCKALSCDGIFIAQAGNFIEQFSEIRNTYEKFKKIFFSVKIHRAPVFDYQLTDFSFILASKKKNLEKISLVQLEKRFKQKKLKGLRYYSPKIHFCSGILPKFYLQKLN